MLSRLAAALALALAAILPSGALPARAHDGHDDARKTVPVANGPGARADATSGPFELVAVAKGDSLVLYLDQFATNAPIADASITVETPSGSLDASAQDGAYRLAAPFLSIPGKHDLIVTVTSGAAIEVMPITLEILTPRSTAADEGEHRSWQSLLSIPGALLVGASLGFALALTLRRRALAALCLVTLAASALPWPATAHEGHDHGDRKTPMAAASGDLAQKLSDGTLFIPKPVQRVFGLRTAIAETGTYKRSLELPGRVIPDPNASGFVQASVGGRLSPPSGGFPRLGTPVKRGDVLAYVSPPIQAIDVSDMRQRQGELDQQISIVEGRLARYQRLAPGGAIPRQLLDEAKLELQGLKDRRASLDTSRRESEALVAPVDGVIADGTPVAGQIAQPNAVVFHIVDPASLWVEALSFSAVSAQLATAATTDGRTLKLAFRGSGFADRSQTIPVHFAIEDDTAGLRAGQFVTVVVSTDGAREGMAVPRAAVVRTANGQDFVFEHIAPERFVARPVRAEALDGARTLILAGLAPGKRIAVQGADLLDHVR